MKRFGSFLSTFVLAMLLMVSSSFISVDANTCSNSKIDGTFSNVLKTSINNSYNYYLIKCHNIFDENISGLIDVEENDFELIPQITNNSTLFFNTKIDKNNFVSYSSPLVTEDILILVQRFLI